MKKSRLFWQFVALVFAVIFSATSCNNESNEKPLVTSFVVGAWHIKSFCGKEADVDLYIEFKSNATFTILQRSNSAGYEEFKGQYSVDEENSIISGVYSDGESWLCAYKYSLSEDGELILESMTESAEISVYERATMPKVVVTRTAVVAGIQSVKPL